MYLSPFFVTFFNHPVTLTTPLLYVTLYSSIYIEEEMTPYPNKSMIKSIRKAISLAVLTAFFMTSVKSPAYAQVLTPLVPQLPKPGVMVHLSPEFTPAHLMGITIHPENSLQFDFLIFKGDTPLGDEQKKDEYKKLVKYFLASLTIPDEDQWVNLSPYEKNRIIKDDFGTTEMGRDLLSQDYLLKQITSSMIYPEGGLGKKFWDTVYQRAWTEYHTTNIPVSTFNKVWIVPDQALVYERGNSAYILQRHLKVMLEEDYLSLEKHAAISTPASSPDQANNDTHALGSQVIREIIIPELEKEVNEGKNFASLRKMYSGMVLATWYKKALRQSLLGKIYADRAKVKGVDQDPRANEQIYQQYLKAFKKGVFNYIKDDVDKYTNEAIPRKYFSGGFQRSEFVAERGMDGVERMVPSVQVVQGPIPVDVRFEDTKWPVIIQHIESARSGESPDLDLLRTNLRGSRERAVPLITISNPSIKVPIRYGDMSMLGNLPPAQRQDVDNTFALLQGAADNIQKVVAAQNIEASLKELEQNKGDPAAFKATLESLIGTDGKGGKLAALEAAAKEQVQGNAEIQLPGLEKQKKMVFLNGAFVEDQNRDLTIGDRVHYDLEDKIFKMQSSLLSYENWNLLGESPEPGVTTEDYIINDFKTRYQAYAQMLQDILHPGSMNRSADRKGFESKGLPEYVYTKFLLPATINWIETIKNLRDQKVLEGVPVIATSGNHDLRAAWKNGLGIEDFFEKPLKLGAFLTRVEELLPVNNTQEERFIVIADDEPFLIEYFSAILSDIAKERNYTIKTVAKPSDLPDLLKENKGKVSLLVSDTEYKRPDKAMSARARADFFDLVSKYAKLSSLWNTASRSRPEGAFVNAIAEMAGMLRERFRNYPIAAEIAYNLSQQTEAEFSKQKLAALGDRILLLNEEVSQNSISMGTKQGKINRVGAIYEKIIENMYQPWGQRDTENPAAINQKLDREKNELSTVFAKYPSAQALLKAIEFSPADSDWHRVSQIEELFNKLQAEVESDMSMMSIAVLSARIDEFKKAINDNPDNEQAKRDAALSFVEFLQSNRDLILLDTARALIRALPSQETITSGQIQNIEPMFEALKRQLGKINGEVPEVSMSQRLTVAEQQGKQNPVPGKPIVLEVFLGVDDRNLSDLHVKYQPVADALATQLPHVPNKQVLISKGDLPGFPEDGTAGEFMEALKYMIQFISSAQAGQFKIEAKMAMGNKEDRDNWVISLTIKDKAMTVTSADIEKFRSLYVPPAEGDQLNSLLFSRMNQMATSGEGSTLRNVAIGELQNEVNSSGLSVDDILKDSKRVEPLVRRIFNTYATHDIRQNPLRIDTSGGDLAITANRKGGIDLNAANLTLQIKRDGNGVPLPLDQQDMSQLNRIQGFIPEIIEIKPAVNIPIFSDLQQRIESSLPQMSNPA